VDLRSYSVRLLAATLLATSAAAQNPATNPDEVSQLRQSLSATRADLQRCEDEIAALRRQLQELQAQFGVPAPSRPSSADFPTLPAITAQEKSGTEPAPAPPSEEQQMLAAKVGEYEQTKVETVSKYKLRVSGLVLVNLSGNRGNVDIQDLPNLAFGGPPALPNADFAATFRQSILGLEITGPRLAGARTSGNVEIDFFGGFPDTNYGVTAGLLRLRTAEARLDWQNTSIIAGQSVPFFSPLSPTSYATLAEPAFSWSGNLWVWTPQLRVEQRWDTSSSSRLALQVGILDPLTEEVPDSQFNRSPTAGERSRTPAFATHLGWKKTLSTGDLILGGGAFYSRQVWDLGRTMDSWSVNADWNLPFTSWMALSGELYRGRAIGGLGGGIWASVLFSGPPSDPASSMIGLNDVGGWSQLKFRATSRLEFNAAAGMANPLARDLYLFPAPTTGYFPPLVRNQTFFVNTVYHPRSNLLLALEYRRLQTSFLSGTKKTADHVNLAAGISF
jgi:hypothetical protein